MGLFRLNKLVLFVLFLLPMLCLSNRQVNALNLTAAIFFVSIINAMVAGTGLNKKTGAVQGLGLFLAEGVIVILAQGTTLLGADIRFFLNSHPIAQAAVSILCFIMFVHFSFIFAKLVFSYTGEKPTVGKKILITISLALFSLGVFYIKHLLTTRAANQKAIFDDSAWLNAKVNDK